MLDSTGKVIGIVTLKAQEEAIGFCIPAEDLVTALANLRVASPEEIRAAGRKHDAAAVFCLLARRPASTAERSKPTCPGWTPASCKEDRRMKACRRWRY